MTTLFRVAFCTTLLIALSLTGYTTPVLSDTTRAFAVPTLTRTPNGNVALSWTEKDAAGTVFFYWAESTDNGQTFKPKQLIFSSVGISNTRLMRPKLLFRKDGQAVAVFALRGPETVTAAGASQAEASHASHTAEPAQHDHGAASAPEKPRADGPARSGNRGGRPSDLQIVYCVSTDGGTRWTAPTPVHQDKTAQIVRGFFDATVLANGEIGVAYLNDIQGRQHERDLRFVSTTGGRFGAEKILDPFVCDCCNISLLVDASGTLNIYYRENQENIRDIARMSSSDNGLTFSKPAILSADNWKINGCPHSGPTSSAGGGTNLVAWYSGTTDAPGIRVVDPQGKRLLVLDDPTAKNAYLVPTSTGSILLWEQSQTAESGPMSMIAYRTIRPTGSSATQIVNKSTNGTNASGLVNKGQLLVAYEVRNANNRNSIEVVQLDL